MMGYKNINKGMRRIIDLQRERIVDPEVLGRIVKALELDQECINALINN